MAGITVTAMQNVPLILAGHGTSSPSGQQMYYDLANITSRQIIDNDVPNAPTGVHVAFVDVCNPTLTDVLDQTGPAVVVPVFLARGYHVQYDIPHATANTGSVVTEPVGPHPNLTAIVANIARQCSRPAMQPDSLLIVSAGSRNSNALHDFYTSAQQLSDALGVKVTAAAFGNPSTTSPTLPIMSIDRLLDHQGTPPAQLVMPYLLAEGYFATKTTQLAATLGIPCGPVIGPHPDLATRIIDLYVKATTMTSPY